MQDFLIYFELGWKHILDLSGYDHILFVAALCATYLLSDWRKVLILVTAFTIGHSITLALSVFNIVNINTAIIEFLIPVTIVITACTNIFTKAQSANQSKIIYIYALFFGFIHGMGFSNYLKSLLGGEGNIALPLFSFNIGLEFGQIVIVLFVLLLSFLVNRFFTVSRREWNLFVSSAIFGIAFMMALERL